MHYNYYMIKSSLQYDRRKGPDFWIRTMQIIQIVSWLLIVPVLIFIQKARPSLATVLDTIFDVTRTQTWDVNALGVIIVLLTLMLFLSIFGLIINFSRKKRKTDKIRFSFILLSIASIIGILSYIFSFVVS